MVDCSIILQIVNFIMNSMNYAIKSLFYRKNAFINNILNSPTNIILMTAGNSVQNIDTFQLTFDNLYGRHMS